jgi:PAS domain S-box-containing protein
MKSKIDIRAFQKRYGLANREMAEVIGCSLPTIQKWRSGEIAISPAASQLLRVLDHSAGGDPVALRDILQSSQTDVDWETANTAAPESEVRRLENSVSEVVDRLELMLDNRRKAKELAQSEVRYRTMMESYAEPICRWLPDTTLTYVNAAYRDLFSQFGDDLIGRKWIEFVPKEKRPQIHMLVADIVRRGEVETVFHESIDREGVIKYQEWKDIPIKNEHGEVVELHSIGRDLTERFHLKRELAAHRRSLEAALDWEGHGLVIFDKKGQFLETNTRFRDEMLAGKVATSFAEWVPRFQSLKFKRLLKRLNSEGELTFRVSVEGQTFLLNLRLLDRSEASTRYLALVKRGIGSGTLDRLMGVRFASESLIDASEGGLPHSQTIAEWYPGGHVPGGL